MGGVVLHFIFHPQAVGKGIASQFRENVRIGIKPRPE